MLPPRVGDKIQVKFVDRPPQRAVVEEILGSDLRVRMVESGIVLTVSSTSVTNYSLAARKAWLKIPKRGVGRPKGSRSTDRVSVTLRLDRDLWERFQAAESAGKIADRTQTLNQWIRDKLSKLP